MNETLPPSALGGAETAHGTRPPVGGLRYDSPQDLYAAMPQLEDLTMEHPDEHEDALEYLWRLRASPTPEEAITYASFAATPQMAVWWAHETLRMTPDAMNADDREIMELILAWIGTPTHALRHQIMRSALFMPRRTPAVMLGLAAGWSGGSIAPNDPAPVPVYRTPKSVNSAVLSSLAQAQLSQRRPLLMKFIDLAEPIFRVY